MNKCDCYCVDEQIIGWHTPVDPKTKTVSRCNGTKERDVCSCGGDRTKCDFYPDVRQRSLKEQEPKFGEWIGVKDGLPEENTDVLVYRGSLISVYTYIGHNEWEDDYGYWSRTDDDGITHWMPLPEPPTDKEN